MHSGMMQQFENTASKMANFDHKPLGFIQATSLPIEQKDLCVKPNQKDEHNFNCTFELKNLRPDPIKRCVSQQKACTNKVGDDYAGVK